MKKFISSLKNIFFLMKPYWKYGKMYCVITILVAVVISPLNSVASVLFSQAVVDAVSMGAAFSDVMKIIGIFLAVLLATLIVQTAYDKLYSESKKEYIQQKINLEIYNNVLQTDYEYFDDPEFYDNHTWAIKEYAAKAHEANELIANILRTMATILSMVSIILILGPWLIVISLLEMGITLFFETKRNKLNIKRQEEILPKDRRLNYVHRIFYQKEYAADIKTTRIRDFLFEFYHENGKDKIAVIKKYAVKGLFWLYAQNFVAILYNALIMGYISYETIVSKRINGVGKFMSLIAANSQMMASLYGFLGFISQANSLNLYAVKIRVFFETPSHIESNTDGIKDIPVQPFSVKIENLFYTYKNSQFGLKNINISAKPGEKIAIVGENGAGKTTLIKLLLKLYLAEGGNITYNNHRIEEYSTPVLRSRIGVAFQATNIYALSLAQNLMLYHKADDSSAEVIISKLELDKMLQKSAQTKDAELTREFDPNGLILSTGEKQKIGLGRIMTQQFGLLLLDEPSSTLDPIAEYKLAELLYGEANKTTTIIVSHRLSMARNADCIIVMKEGCICEKGSHEELMERKGFYYEMFQKQAESYVG